MFKSMQKFLSTCTAVSIILAEGKDGTITVTVMPLPKQSGDDAKPLSKPLHLEGTPEELDEQFVQILGNFQEARKSLIDQMEATTAILAVAKAEQAKKSTSAVKKSAATPKPETVVEGGEDDDDGCGDESCGEEKPQGSAAAASQSEEDNLFA